MSNSHPIARSRRARARRSPRGALRAGHRRRASPSATRVPAQTDGEYLARAGDCIACHTARGGEPFAGGLEMPTPFGTIYTPNITPDPETGIGKWTCRRLLSRAARRQVEGRLASLSGVPVSELHEGHARGRGRDLRLHPDDRAGEEEEHAAQDELPVQPAQPPDRLARAVLHAGRVQARPEAVRRMEPRRVSRAGPRPLRRVPHEPQPPRARRRRTRSCRAASFRCRTGMRRRSRPTAKRGSASGRPTRWWRSCAPASASAASCSGRWRRSSTTACSTSPRPTRRPWPCT